MNIKQPPAARRIQELVEFTDEQPSPALASAVQERIDRLRSQRFDTIAARLQELRPLFEKIPPSWEIDELLYDENGLPK